VKWEPWVFKRELPAHKHYVFSVAYSPEGGTLATFANGTLYTWNTQTGEQLGKMESGDAIGGDQVGFISGNRWVFVREAPTGHSLENRIRVWDTQKQLKVLDTEDVYCGEVRAEDGVINFVRFWEDNYEVREWSGDTKDVRTIAKLESEAFDELTDRLPSYISADHRIGMKDGTGDHVEIWSIAKWWDSTSWERVCILDGDVKSKKNVQFSADGTRVLVVDDSQSGRLWNTRTGELIQTFRDMSHEFSSLVIGRDLIVATTEKSDYPALWRVDTGQKFWNSKLETFMDEQIIFSPDGRTALLSDGISAFVIDGRTGERLTRQLMPSFVSVGSSVVRPVASAYSSDGNQLALASTSYGEVYLFRRRRPEHWWGVAWLPEFWLTLVLGVGLVWSVWRDRRLAADRA